jgi:hypothetical protein
MEVSGQLHDPAYLTLEKIARKWVGPTAALDTVEINL